jgi:hypothetical protein
MQAGQLTVHADRGSAMRSKPAAWINPPATLEETH